MASDNKLQQTLQQKIVLLERNNKQLTNIQKQLVEQNSTLKKEVSIAERKLFARNERIQALEALLQDAQEKLTAQNQTFEVQLQAVRERLEQARSQKSFMSFEIIDKPLFEPKAKEEKEQSVAEVKKQLIEASEHINLAHQDIEILRKELNTEKVQTEKVREQHEKQLKELSEKDEKIKQLQVEIACFRHQELAPRARNKKAELEQLINTAKTKVGNLEKIVDSLLETQKQINEGKPESNEYYLAKGQLVAYQNVLEVNLTKEEIQTLLDKQIELHQLEEQLSKLQQNQQTAQIQQNIYPPKQ